MPCNIVPTIKTNGGCIYVNGISCPFSNMFGHIDLGLFWQIYVQSMVQWGFIVGSQLWSCFKNFYEWQVSCKVEKDVCFIKEHHPLLVQLLFFCQIQIFFNETYWKTQASLLGHILKHSMLFVKGVQIQANLPLLISGGRLSLMERFDVLMAMFFIDPLRASTTTSSNGQKTITP